MSIVPLQRGGWWHDYVCPTHGTELEPERDGVYPCPHGCELAGEPYAAAWLVYRHQALAREARFLARSPHTDAAEDPQDRARQILDEYASFYAGVSRSGWNEGSEGWMLKGKLFSQALTEAQWAVQIADAVLSLNGAGRGVGRPVVEMLQGLLETIVAARGILVDDRNDERSNYTAWLNTAGLSLATALQSCGEAAETEQWVKWSFQHVRIANFDDGWEWEGSTYYHVFVLRAYLLGLRGMDPAEIPADVAQILAAMVRVLVEIAAPDGRLPIIHDGPYNRAPMHREVLEIDILAGQLFKDTGLANVGAWARRALGGRESEPEDLLTGWFTGDPVAGATASRGSVYYPNVGFAVLRDDEDRFQAVIDAGPHGGSHGHFDKLAVYLYGQEPWQPAPGVPPYASPLRHGHYARTLAHPTVRVDGQDQKEGTGSVDHWDEEGNHLIASADGVIPGIALKRELMIRDGLLVDIMRVSATDGLDHDVALALRPATGFALQTSGGLTTSTWTGPEGPEGTGAVLTGFHRASVPAAIVLKPGRGPSDDPSVILPVADWEAKAHDVTFVSVYSFDPNNRPAGVDIRFAGNDAVSIHIRSSSEDVTTIEVP